MERFKHTGYSACGGIILAVIGISGEDVVKTIVLGTIGTAVSFAVSAMLEKLFKKRQ